MAKTSRPPTKAVKPAAPVAAAEAKDAPKSALPPQEKQKSVIAHSVFLVVSSTGARGGQDDIALHEIPLLKRKLRTLKQELVIGRLSDASVRVRGEDLEDIQAIYNRLQTRYTFLPEGMKEGDEVDLVASLYGEGREGLKALALTMRGYKRAYDELMKKAGPKGPNVDDLEELIAKHGPERTIENELLEASEQLMASR